MKYVGTRGHDVQTNDIDTLIKFCKDNGLGGLHLALYMSFPEEFNDKEKMHTYIQKLLDNGIEVYVHGAYFNMLDPKNSDTKLYNQVSDTVKDTNTKWIASETGSYDYATWTYVEGNHDEEAYQLSKSIIEKIIKDNPEIEVTIEPVWHHVMYNVETVKRLFSEVGRLKIVHDLTNMLYIGNHQDYKTVLEDSLTEFKDDIVVFHFKSFKVEDKNLVRCPLEDGYLDYEYIVSEIKRHKLDHIPVIVEELQGEDLIRSIKYIKEL